MFPICPHLYSCGNGEFLSESRDARCADVHPPKKIEKDEFNSGSSSFAPLLRLLAQRGAYFLVDAPWCAFASLRRRLF